MNNGNNIILIGMPGSGKSTAGVLSAKALCKDFFDTDLLIQSNEKIPLQDIINLKGTEYFISCEEKAIVSLDLNNTVIATGGSVIYSEKAMTHLKSLGKIVYLKLSEDTMKSRIKNITTRGVVIRQGNTLSEMYAERSPLYKKFADVIIDCDKRTVEQTVSDIVRLCPKFCVNSK